MNPVCTKPSYQREFCRPLYGDASDSYSTNEIEKMEELIISLSNESSDESRRQRVSDIFTEELAKPNGSPQRFSTLFGNVLIVIGDRVRSEAMKKVDEQKEIENSQKSSDDDENNHSVSSSIPEKSSEELQVWALVDMMIQSKTIVKKAAGELGSEGVFG
jgi:hypothetical protein